MVVPLFGLRKVEKRPGIMVKEKATVIQADNLEKRYGNLRVLRGVSFRVGRGEIFSIVGPNGSGKTTTMEILEGTRSRDGGSFSILGSLPKAREVRERIGVALQDADAFSNLKIEEIIHLHRSFYRRSLPIDFLLTTVGLQQRAKSFIRNLSGGEKQRLNLAVALVNDPEVLFLDEPSEGLDPRVRMDIWNLLISLRDEGKTILLTTHYMEEAERLSDRVAILGRGKILASGPPAELIAGSGLPKRIELEFNGSSEPLLDMLNGGYSYTRDGERKLVFSTFRAELDLEHLLSMVRASGLSILNLDVRSPGLQDVYLALTGEAR